LWEIDLLRFRSLQKQQKSMKMLATLKELFRLSWLVRCLIELKSAQRM